MGKGGVGCVKGRTDLARDILGLGCTTLTAGWDETLDTCKEDVL